MISIDTNIFIYAADPDSKYHKPARNFFKSIEKEEVVLCELVLIELYMLFRNPAVFIKPYSAQEAVDFCKALKENPRWRTVDYLPEISPKIWDWASKTSKEYRALIDARLALTLRYHGVTKFVTANVKDFQEFGFQKVWNPILTQNLK
jgi:uncharacterized protein